MPSVALLIFALAYLFPMVVSSYLPGVIVVRDSAAFVGALVEFARATQEAASSRTLLITQDVKVAPEDWPPDTLSNPLVLKINVNFGEGMCLAVFSSSYDAITWSLSCKHDLLVADWPEELLEHELCEVVEVRTAGGTGELTGGGAGVGGSGGSAVDDPHSSGDVSDTTTTTTTVLLRGLRIRVGIDCSADLLADVDPATGRMDYRGRVMNRAARIAARATSGCIMCSEEAWLQSQRAIPNAGRTAAESPSSSSFLKRPQQGGLMMRPRSRVGGDVVARKAGCFDLKGVGQMVLYTCNWVIGRRPQQAAQHASRAAHCRSRAAMHAAAQGLTELRPLMMDGRQEPESSCGSKERQRRSLELSMRSARGCSSLAPRVKDAATQTDQD